MPQKTNSLHSFLSGLFSEGEVIVAYRLESFSEVEEIEAQHLLEEIHTEEQLNTPHAPIPFDATAAIWSAKFLYRAVQAALLRALDEDTIKKELKLYPGTITAASICSADLCLRYMGDLSKLTKGLAPGDILLAYFNKLAFQWPYSAIGWATLPNKEQLFDILKHEGLRLLFLERLLDKKAYSEIKKLQLTPWIHTLTGLYPKELLPEVFNHLENENEYSEN
ncbi:MAG: hypothetical protein KTR30_35440 [Saprospiraceae bacterium]|nr:hypothetical protein [Saprospiraceae bacterium]